MLTQTYPLYLFGTSVNRREVVETVASVVETVITRSDGLNTSVDFSIAKRLCMADMLLSEDVLGRDWNTTEEDEAWADL